MGWRMVGYSMEDSMEDMGWYYGGWYGMVLWDGIMAFYYGILLWHFIITAAWGGGG